MLTASVENVGKPAFFAGIFAMNLCFSLLLLSHVPIEYDDPQEFSYIVGHTCDGVTGKSTLQNSSSATIRCVQVFIEERTEEKLRTFMELYIASLLLSVYLLHQIKNDIVSAAGFKRLSELLFITSTVAETGMLIISAAVVYASWESGKLVTSDPDGILRRNMPFIDMMRWIIVFSTAVRIFNWTLLGVIVCMDSRARLREWSASWSAAVRNKLFSAIVPYVYTFCFTIFMNVDMLLVMYFYIRKELPYTDFSYLAGGDCDDVAGMSETQFLSTASHDQQMCVRHLIENLEQERLPGFLGMYLTVAFFYVLLIVEALDFFHSEKMKQRARVFLAVVLLGEAAAFVGSTWRMFNRVDLTEFSLARNDPNAILQQYIFIGIFAVRVSVMSFFYGMYVYDHLYFAEEPTEEDKSEDTNNKEVLGQMTTADFAEA